MKVNTSARTLDASGDFESVSFAIDEEDSSHVIRVLRDSIYSDGISAVLREYGTNCWDAHNMVGTPDRPFLVCLPTRLSPLLRIRDYGPGLSDELVFHLYSKYGKSTKRDTNGQIGQLGFGCKSGFAYGDNFLIISYYGGKKTTFNAFLDPSDVGMISKMAVEDTDEPTGIEIQIAVDEDDIDEFVQKAQRVYRPFTVRPIIEGHNISFAEEETLIEDESDDKAWRVMKYGESSAVMGCIAYPLKMDAIKWTDEERDIRTLAQLSVQLKFEIGDLNIAASREGLKYDKPTIAAIKNALKNALTSILAQLNKGFVDCKTMYEAKELYGKIYDFHSPLYKLRSLVSKGGINYKGKPVSSDFFTVDSQTDGFYVKRYEAGKARPKAQNSIHVRCTGEIPVFLNDINGGVNNRLAPILELDGTDEKNTLDKKYDCVYVVYVTDDAKYHKYVTDNSFDMPMTNLSQLPKFKLSEIYGATATGAVKNSKHVEQAFTLDLSRSSRYRPYYGRNGRSNYFHSVAVDAKDGKGLYVNIDRFKIKSKFKELDPHQVVDAIKTFAESMGIHIGKVYAFKGKASRKLGDGWLELFDWMDKTVAKVIERDKLAQAIVDKRALCKLDLDIVELVDDCHAKAKVALPKNIKSLKDKIEVMEHGNADSKTTYIIMNYSWLVEAAAKDTKPTYDLKSALETFKKQYKFLADVFKRFGGSYSWNYQGEMSQSIVDYVAMVDLVIENNLSGSAQDTK